MTQPHPRLRTVSLNAGHRIEAYWNAHHTPLRLYRLSHIYGRSLIRLGHTLQDMLAHPDFIAAVHVVELTTFQRLLLPRRVWDAMSMEGRLEFLQRYQGGTKKKVTPRSVRTARRVAMEPTVRDYTFLPVTDVVERPSIDEIIRARRRNG